MLAGVIVVSLTFYALLAGADFGAGVWSLMARGQRAAEQRALIADSIAPIWEANHVWMILVVTVLFTGFPKAFSLITTVLHIPLTLMLIGIVLRGSAFAFRTHDVPHAKNSGTDVLWERVFAASSIFTPVMLGVTIGAIASGRVTRGGAGFVAVFVRPWLAPFPIAVGLFSLALFAFLAAVYLTLDARSADLKEDFRRRALAAAGIVAGLALVVLVLSKDGAPEIREGLAHSVGGRLILGLAVVSALAAVGLLGMRRYRAAAVSAAAEVALIIWGWALAQYPYLVEPDLTIMNAAAPPSTQRLLLAALIAGAVLLFPSLYYLYRIFKGQVVFESRGSRDRGVG
ncbi:cytochrome d ubiquinol oxidase subunit II [Candidatus Nitrospira bockiana]